MKKIILKGGRVFIGEEGDVKKTREENGKTGGGKKLGEEEGNLGKKG
jgi:hypothetical protein